MVVAGRWFRVSGDKQDEQNQYERVDGLIAGKGYTPGKTYIAHANSASKREHLPLLREAIGDIKSGLIDCLVMRHTNRVDRTEELALIIKEVKEAGGWLESVEEPWVAEVSGLGEKLMVSVTEYMNAKYIKDLSANVRDAQARRRAAGSYASGTAPRGYTIIGYHADGTEHPQPGKCQSCFPDRGGRKTIVPNDDAAIIKRIFTAIADGDSYLTVARALQDDGVPTRNGGAWGAGVIGQIIRKCPFTGSLRDTPMLAGV
jgi:DNA invertase Pin-like site-specific DNA recombinase